MYYYLIISCIYYCKLKKRWKLGIGAGRGCSVKVKKKYVSKFNLQPRYTFSSHYTPNAQTIIQQVSYNRVRPPL